MAKKKVLIRHLAESCGLIPKPTHQRIMVQISEKVKNDVQNFYLRDDILYQLPGKRDSIVIREADRSKTIHQKRILLSSLLENYELFIEENSNISISRSSFAELRPPFVIPKAALAHRNCLYLYRENICLLLKSLDKHVNGNYWSSLEKFTDSLVCSTENVQCMFGQCELCVSCKLKKIL